MLKLIFEKPKIGIGISDEAKNLIKRNEKPLKKKEKPKPWTHKERLLVGSFLTLTIFASLYFYFQGQGKLPELKFNFGGFGFNETIILEK